MSVPYFNSIDIFQVAACKKSGKIPQKSNGQWGCIQTSSICEPDQDQSTLHEDSKTGEWICCSKGEKLVDGTCEKPREQSKSIRNTKERTIAVSIVANPP
jgi:hypothetical protein